MSPAQSGFLAERAADIRQWEASFARDDARQPEASLAATEVINPLSIAAIDTGLVLKVLEQIWGKDAGNGEPNSREARSDPRLGARARLPDRRNPARWKNHLDHILPSRRKIAAVEHLITRSPIPISRVRPRPRAKTSRPRRSNFAR